MTRENILLISKDVLKANYLSCYGGDKWNTKNIDELADKGTIFKNYYTSAPSTSMSFTSMFSGLNPFQLDRKRYTEVEPFDKCPTLFDKLKKRGYNCHIIWDESFLPKAYRFSKVYGDNTSFHNLNIKQTVAIQPEKVKPNKNAKPLEKIIEEVKKIFEKQNSDIFLWIHCPHVFEGRTGYGSDIDLFDKLVGKMREFFSDDEIFITADHGHMDLNKGIPRYGFHVYESAIKIPLITPDYFDKDEITKLVSNIQLKNIILNKEVNHQEYIISDTQYYLQENRKLSIMKDNYKYIYNKIDSTEELYDLEYDPNEDVNLLVDHIYDRNRGEIYYLDEVFYYPQWETAREYYNDLRDKKEEIWEEGSWVEETIYNKARTIYRNLVSDKFNFIFKQFKLKKSKKDGRWKSKPRVEKYDK